MAPSSSKDQQNLSTVRAEIDRLDRQILSALEERAALASAVLAAKSGQSVFRPGREADLIRRLVASSSLPPLMIEMIWRQIIANNITGQQKLKVALMDDAASFAVCGFCFGASVDHLTQTQAKDVITAVAQGEADLGVLPHWRVQSDWLKDLLLSDGSAYIVAVSPLLEGHHWAGTPLADGVIIARDLPDASEADITLCLDGDVAVEHDGYDAEAEGLLGIFQNRSFFAIETP